MNTMKTTIALALLLTGAALAQDLALDTRTAPQAMNAATAAVPYEIELGYRWSSIDGNEAMYRAQINERDGFLIKSFTLQTTDFGGRMGLFDHIRLDASELGAGPAGMFRLEAGRSGSFNLRFNYRQADMYSALPRLANPFLASGIIPGQHTLDLDRQTVDVDLELLRWRSISPFIGYTHYTSSGPGTTSYTLGGDDFLLASDQEESEDELRVGFGFTWRALSGQVTQGWRTLDADETMTLLEGAGNNPGNVLGRPVTANGLTRNGETSVDAPFTNVYVTGDLGSRIRLVADYVTFDAETESRETEVAAGNFVSFGLRRFFQGLEETVDSRADSNSTRGGLRAEVVLVEGVDLIASYQMRERDLSGNALIESLYTNTLNFSNADPRDITELLEAENSLDREDTIVLAGVRARALGPFSVWAYYSQTQQDLTMTPSLEEIVVPTPERSQGGAFERSIDAIDLGGTFARAGFTLQASYRMDDADDAILRTDYQDRGRTRVRAGWGTQNGRIHVGALAERTDLENDTEGIGYDGEISRMTADFEVGVIEPLRLWGSYTDFRSETEILLRKPETFDIVTSLHDEDGDAIEAGARLAFARFALDASFAQFQNEGTTPFDLDRLRVGAGFDITPRYGISAEYVTDEYAETGTWQCGIPVPCVQAPGLGNYDAERIGVYFRVRP
ncbi:MAG TPA: porin [Thermoanaerobaculia bacterium]